MDKRNRELDFIKVIATILLVLHHFQQIMNVRFSYINFFGGKFYMGNLVEMFFIISGICACHWIEGINGKSRFKKFYFDRVKRLLPVMSISIVVDSLLYIYFFNLYHITIGAYSVDVKNVIISCLGIQAGWGFENPMINSPMWYISVLMLCYIIFYFVTKLSNTMKISPYILYALLIIIGLFILREQLDLPFLNEYTARGYVSFFEGMILGCILNKKKELIDKISIWAIVPFVIGTVGYMKGFHIYYMLVILMWPSLIIFFRNRVFKKFINGSIWSKMAKVSYDTYVWHCPILHFAYGIVKVNNISYCNTIWFTTLTVIVICVLGYISFIFLEKPIQKLISDHLYKKVKE